MLDQKGVFRTFFQEMNHFRLKGTFCDAYLIVGESTLKAHKIILAAGSQFFQETFINSGDNNSSSPFFKIDGISPADMLLVLDFLYTGQMSLNKVSTNKALNLSKLLKIPTLEEMCKGYEAELKHMKYKLKMPRTRKQKETGCGSKTRKENYITTNSANTNSSPQQEEANSGFHNYCVVDNSHVAGEVIVDGERSETVLASDLGNTKGGISDKTQAPVDRSLSSLDSNTITNLNDGNTSGLSSSTINDSLAKSTEVLGEVGTSGDVTENTNSLSTTTRKKRKPRVYFCKHCHNKYTTLQTIRLHMEGKHPDKLIQCKTCHRRFINQKHIDRHLDNCIIERFASGEIYQCPECPGVTYSRKDKAVAHYRKKHTKTFHRVCEVCNSNFTSLDQFYNHHLQAHDTDITQFFKKARKIFNCEVCGYKTVTHASFKYHMETHHTEVYICQLCSKIFKSEIALQNHLKTSHGAKLQCSQCSFTTGYAPSLRSHEYKLHGIVDPKTSTIYKCPYCTYLHITKVMVNRHIRSVHSEPTLQCAYCTMKFRRPFEKRIHERRHTGEKPFSCELCSYRSTTKQLLRVHMRHTHSQEKAYVCELCGFRTKGPTNLYLHRRRCIKRRATMELIDDAIHSLRLSNACI